MTNDPPKAATPKLDWMKAFVVDKPLVHLPRMDGPIDGGAAPLLHTIPKMSLDCAAEGQRRLHEKSGKTPRRPIPVIELIPGNVLADGSVSLDILPRTNMPKGTDFASGLSAIVHAVMVPVSEIVAIGRERESDIPDLSVCEVLTRSGLSGWAQALTLFLGVDEDDVPVFELLDMA